MGAVPVEHLDGPVAPNSLASSGQDTDCRLRLRTGFAVGKLEGTIELRRQNRAKKTKSSNFCAPGRTWCNKSPQQPLGSVFDLAQPPSPSSTHFRMMPGRDAHLSGKVAKALMEKAPELLAEPPKIEKADVLADRLPG